MIVGDKKNKPVPGFLVVPKVERTVKFVKSMFGEEEQQCFQTLDGKTWYSVMRVDGVPLSFDTDAALKQRNCNGERFTATELADRQLV